MIPKVPTSERGTATLGITVAEKFLRNRKITITTNATVSISENWTSLTEARMVSVRSVRMETLTADEREVCNCGSNFFIRSATAMMFAPGWPWMLTITAGASFIHAACLAFSVPSINVAKCGAQVLHAQAVRRERGRVRLNSDCGLLSAADRDQTDSR